MPVITFESILAKMPRTDGLFFDSQVLRAKVPGGWLLRIGHESIAFIPDPNHTWDGGSLP